jgi:hypothetical protein
VSDITSVAGPGSPVPYSPSRADQGALPPSAPGPATLRSVEGVAGLGEGADTPSAYHAWIDAKAVRHYMGLRGIDPMVVRWMDGVVARLEAEVFA